MICFNSAPSMVSRSISRLAIASSDGFAGGEDLPHFIHRFVDEAAYFFVDFAGGLFAVHAGSAKIGAAAGKERRAIAFAEIDAAHAAHAVIHDHRSGDVAGTFQIVLGAGGNVVERHFFGDRAGQQHLDAAFQFALRHQVAIVFGALHGVAQRRQAAGDDRNFVNRIGIRQAVGDQSVAGFVIGDALFFVGVDHAFAFFQAGGDAFDALVEFVHADGGFVLSRGQAAPLR